MGQMDEQPDSVEGGFMFPKVCTLFTFLISKREEATILKTYSMNILFGGGRQ